MNSAFWSFGEEGGGLALLLPFCPKLGLAFLFLYSCVCCSHVQVYVLWSVSIYTNLNTFECLHLSSLHTLVASWECSRQMLVLQRLPHLQVTHSVISKTKYYINFCVENRQRGGKEGRGSHLGSPLPFSLLLPLPPKLDS